jgi:hypothetical protein
MVLILKSMPMVEMKVVLKASSENLIEQTIWITDFSTRIDNG